MRRWLPNGLSVLALLALVLGGVFYWLFYDNRPPGSGHFELNIAALQNAAGPASAGPQSIEVEQLSHTAVPRIAIVAGTDWQTIDMVRASYRLVWPNRSIIVDTAFPATLAKQSGARSYDQAAWKRLLQAMEKADVIIVTHEHADHIGGLMAAPNAANLLARARLTPEQVDAGTRSTPYRWATSDRMRYKPLKYRGIYRLAPGVVLIRAPGHTPGSQMIYVRRRDGHEFLFAGDAASMLDNVRLERIRSRYVTTFQGGHADDREAVMLQTEAMHDALARDPNLTLVPGHDGSTFETLIRSGLLVREFHLR